MAAKKTTKATTPKAEPASEPKADSPESAQSAVQTGETGEAMTPAAASYVESNDPEGAEVPFDTLWVKARKGSFRRAGYAFNEREEKVLAVADLSEDQLAALLEESQLIVTAGLKED